MRNKEREMKNTNSNPILFLHIYFGNRKSTQGYHWESKKFFRYNKSQQFSPNPKSSPRVTFAKQDIPQPIIFHSA